VTEKILFSMCDFTLGDFLISALQFKKLTLKIITISKQIFNDIRLIMGAG